MFYRSRPKVVAASTSGPDGPGLTVRLQPVQKRCHGDTIWRGAYHTMMIALNLTAAFTIGRAGGVPSNPVGNSAFLLLARHVTCIWPDPDTTTETLETTDFRRDGQ